MKILVVGGGGREHAIVHALSRGGEHKLFCAPGNAGIAQLAECVPLKADDVAGVVRFCVERAVDFVVVAPEDPLARGMVDALEAAGIPAFGPSAAAAEIESSKVFSKGLMKKYGVPTAGYEVFEAVEPAMEHIRARAQWPAVIKADGLALGKGVIIAANEAEARAALELMLVEGGFGGSGRRVVVEDFLTGTECTVLCFVDGEHISPMPSSKDHKRVFDGDLGPNTGGMGAYSPGLAYGEDMAERCMREIFRPTVDAMAAEGRPFKGVLYFGLMLTADGPKVIEYNSRFGDPETQTVLPRLKGDLLEIMRAVRDGTLDMVAPEWDERPCVCVCMASGGYPGRYDTGKPITGIEQAEALGVTVYHAGTAAGADGPVTAGGRVLGVTAMGDTMAQARDLAYRAAALIKFEGAHMRTDIGG